jgi:histone H3/H4
MDLKYEIWKFPFLNIFDTKSEVSDNDIDIDNFLEGIVNQLQQTLENFEKDLMGKVKSLLSDLCKNVKKKTVTDDDIFKYDKHKPLI